MDFKQLRYFVRIAELGNMTRASESLCIAQPALSQQIANLEAELDTRLFDRSVQGVKPTQSGQLLLRHAKSLLKQLEDTRAAIANETDQPTGRVSIGIPGSTGRILAIPLLHRLQDSPGILVELVERPSGELVDLVAAGRLDLAIAVDAQPRRGVQLAPLILEELYAIFRPDGRRRKVVSIRELSENPLILAGPASTIRQRVEAAFLAERLNYRLVAEVGATDLLIRLVSAGLGWTVLSWAGVVDEVARGDVVAVPLARPLHRDLSLCVSDALPLSRAAEAVRAAVVDIAEHLLESGEWSGVRRLEA